MHLMILIAANAKRIKAITKVHNNLLLYLSFIRRQYSIKRGCHRILVL